MLTGLNPALNRIKYNVLPMKKFSHLLISGSLFAVSCAGLATTVIPPSFDDLVSRAEMIIQGSVTDVRSEWTGEGAQRHIMSYVTVKVEDAIKGNPGASVTLRMLGGTVGAETMQVSDAPKFKVGDRDILFVENNGTQFIPLVGIMHGRFKIKKDETGRDIQSEGFTVVGVGDMSGLRKTRLDATQFSPTKDRL